ncbi:acid-sensing ion channel 4-A-like isoform X2 [Dendronephthya gigantea]|uniref:acid-sensing ion channel 4-A-like isoform X2 n=1 Tax=Dendronephthya gigantea TaxID=151771 RepID=UPI00106B0141|nr:acid-sensing ion channel 4-A-like isoform X2 [Dendronephthya gigantea]
MPGMELYQTESRNDSLNASRNMEKMREAEAEQPNESSDKENIPKLIRNFLGYTTAHGFSRLEGSKGIFWKIFWALVCLGSFGMFVYQVHGLFEQWLSRPIATNVRITFEKEVSFPAVTICNLNMLRANKIPKELKKEMLKLIGVYNESSDTNSTKARRRRSISSPKPIGSTLTTTPYKTFHKTENTDGYLRRRTTSRSGTTQNVRTQTSHRRTKYKRDNHRRADEEYLPSAEEVDQNVLFLERFTAAVTKVPTDILIPAGHQLDDLVTKCTWRGYDCMKSSNYTDWWVQNWHYKYGNCYTFNGGVNQNGEAMRTLSTSKPGPSQGLSLRLNIQQEEYLKYVSDEAGVRVILHDQGMMPFPYLEGFSVGPGTATSVGIQKTVISRVDRFKNHTCWELDELDEENIYRKFYKITKYTQQTCHNSCVGKTQLKECGCAEYSYPSNTSACDVYNATTQQCLWDIQKRFNRDKLPCMDECRLPCREEVIEKTISMSQWPSTAYQATYEKKMSFSSESYLLLNIFYNALNYQRIEENFVYDEINLLADIGGQLGLWIGVSVITVFELIELFALILTRLCRRKKAMIR